MESELCEMACNNKNICGMLTISCSTRNSSQLEQKPKNIILDAFGGKNARGK